jgi:molecular chaperone GrpE
VAKKKKQKPDKEPEPAAMAEEAVTTEPVAEESIAEAVAEQATEAVEPAAPEAAPDELAALRQELAEARVKEAEYLDGWQRARAELANARKRFQREQEQAYDHARANVLVRLLPISDDLARAVETLPAAEANAAWVEGIGLIQRKLQVLLEQEGVSAIEAAGQMFDPSLHQAITHESNAEVPEGHIIAELQRGYKIGERVLRPSVVRVSSGPTAAPAAEPEEEAAPADEEAA